MRYDDLLPEKVLAKTSVKAPWIGRISLDRPTDYTRREMARDFANLVVADKPEGFVVQSNTDGSETHTLSLYVFTVAELDKFVNDVAQRARAEALGHE